MIGAAGDNPDTASTDRALIEAMVTAAEDWMHADRITFEALDAYDRERIARHITPKMLAAVRAHQHTTGRHTAAQALRDAADALEVNAPVIARRATSKTNAVHLAARRVAAHADALDAAGEDEDRKTVPRCQHISPSPWGPTQCARPDGHDGRHAYSPSEAIDDTPAGGAP